MSIPLTAPRDGSVLVNAGQWTVDLLSTSLATGISVIAVAGIGFLMLTGRMDLRRAGTVVLGCFLLFGAGSIANGLSNLAQAESANSDRMARYAPTQIRATRPARPATRYDPFDPYAGASLINGRNSKSDWQPIPRQ